MGANQSTYPGRLHSPSIGNMPTPFLQGHTVWMKCYIIHSMEVGISDENLPADYAWIIPYEIMIPQFFLIFL